MTMAMDPTRMANDIASALVAAGAISGAATNALALGIATAIVNELKNHADVLPLPALVAPTGGGPVTGTGSLQ